MKLTELFESDPIDLHHNTRSREGFDRMAAGAPKHASFCFGRMNPPTIGHKELLAKTAESAIGGEYYIFLSKKQEPKENPLPYETKLAFINEMFPEYEQHIVRDEGIKTPLLAADWLYNKGIRAITMVAGSDRLPEYEKLMAAWNSPEVRRKYGRDECHISFVSSGDREEGAEGVAGVSASGARTAAKTGDLEKFMETTGTSGDLGKRLYDAVRAGMGVKTVNESAGRTTLGNVARVGTKMPDADFWVRRSGSDRTVGEVLTEYNPDAIGIKVTATDVVNPSYLRYVFQHLHGKGVFAKQAIGSTNLVHIKSSDIANMVLSSS